MVSQRWSFPNWSCIWSLVTYQGPIFQRLFRCGSWWTDGLSSRGAENVTQKSFTLAIISSLTRLQDKQKHFLAISIILTIIILTLEKESLRSEALFFDTLADLITSLSYCWLQTLTQHHNAIIVTLIILLSAKVMHIHISILIQCLHFFVNTFIIAYVGTNAGRYILT